MPDILSPISKTINDKNFYYVPYNKMNQPWLLSTTNIYWDSALYINEISQPLLIEASGENIDISTNKFINLYSDTIFKQNLNICGEIIFNTITINDSSSNLNNLTLTGELKGPPNFIINPSPDNNKGVVTIKGSLIVDGSTTIINSTIVDISDKKLLLASNATSINEIDRAGLEISGNKSILYHSAEDAFVTNISFETTNLKVNNTIISKNILAIDDDGNQIDVTQIATEGTSVLKLQIDASFDNVDISGKLHANTISAETIFVGGQNPVFAGGRFMGWYYGTITRIKQSGADIDGEEPGESLGRSVALNSDGTILAAGAPYNDNNGENAGQVRVYQWNDVSWNQLGNDIDGEAEGDYSGTSVSLNSDGTILAIGAPYNDGDGTKESAGHVRVYQWSDGSWNQLGNDIDGEASGDNFGISVSLSSNGTILAVGAHFKDVNGVSRVGHVRVYQWAGWRWDPLGNDIKGEGIFDNFGYSVSLSSDGTILAIGARNNDSNAYNTGHVRVYQWNDVSWNQLGNDIDGEAEGNFSGTSVSLNSDGTILAIGAPDNDNANGENAGHVRVYQWYDASWNQLGNDIDGEASGDNFGISVSLSSDGTILAIGARYNDGNGDAETGHVRVYQWYDGSWNKLGNDINGDETGNEFGRAVALSGYGNRLVVGGPYKNSDTGHVRAFELVGRLRSASSIEANSIEANSIEANNISCNIFNSSNIKFDNVNNSLAIGNIAGRTDQSDNTIAIGNEAGYTDQNTFAVAIGYHAGHIRQGKSAIAIGENAGKGRNINPQYLYNTEQEAGAIAIGHYAGFDGQGKNAINIGAGSGAHLGNLWNESQQMPNKNSVSIGYYTTKYNAYNDCVAIGSFAAEKGQKEYSISIGSNSSRHYGQNIGSIAIGYEAALNGISDYSIAIGYQAGSYGPKSNNTIILNATGSNLYGSDSSALYIAPIRKLDPTTKTSLLQYTTTYEIVESSNININTIKTNNLSTHVIGKITPVYARGVGDNIEKGKRSMFVKIGSVEVVRVNYDDRVVNAEEACGLTLTIINANTHQHVSSTTYKIANNEYNANKLAADLLEMSNNQIGILTSYDAFEGSKSTELKAACIKLGLTRLAGAIDNVVLNSPIGGNNTEYYIRAPYASIFYGPGNGRGNQALEIMKTNEILDKEDGGAATLSTFLIDDAFIGQQITNALYNPNSRSDRTDASVFVDYIGNVGIGITEPICKLDVCGAIHLRGERIVHNTIEDNQIHTYISFGEAGTGSDWAYLRQIGESNKYNLALDFHDNGGDAGFVIRDVHSTRSPDIVTTRFKVARGGNVGIGTDNPNYKLDVVGDTKLNGYVGIDTNPDTTSSRYKLNVNGKIFSTGLDVNGNVGISKTNPIEALDVSGNIKASGSIIATDAKIMTDNTFYDGAAMFGYNDDSILLNSTNYAISQIKVNQSILVTRINSNIGGRIEFWNGGKSTVIGGREQTAAVEHARFDESGNFGIGFTDPTEKLDVNGNIVLNAHDNGNGNGIFFRRGFNPGSSTDNLSIYNCSILTHAHEGNNSDGLSINGAGGVSICTNSNTTRIERFRVAKNGNVGIGFTDPTEKLDVNGNIVLNAAANGVGKGIYFRRNYSPGGTNSSEIYNCSILTHAHEGNNSDGLSINGFDGVSICTGNSSTRQERIRVANNGNVGIGTINPACKLHVEGAIALRPQLMPYDIDRGTVSDTINRENTYIAFAPNAGSDWAYLRYLGGGDSIRIALDFHDNGNDAGFEIRDIQSNIGTDQITTRFKVQRGGNVGIGTDNPTAKLDVSGNIKATGNIEANRNATSTSYFGKAAIGEAGTHPPNAGFSHINHAVGITGYALQQDVDGNTYLNAQTDEYIRFDIGGQPKMMLDNTGNFGIGTTDPDYKLHVNGNIKVDDTILAHTGSYQKASQIGKAMIGGFTTSNHNSDVYFSNAHYHNSTDGYGMRISQTGQTVLNSAYDTNLYFSISGDSKMIIDKSGNVGIGTDDPICKLDVNGAIHLRSETIGTELRGYKVDLSNRTHTYIAFGYAGSNDDWAYLRQIGEGNKYNLALDFHDDADDAGFVIRDVHSNATDTQHNQAAFPDPVITRFKVERGGNVGIGTDNPDYRLHVIGDIKVDQTILAHTDSTTAASQIGKAMIGAVPGATSDVYFSNAGSHTSDKYGMRLSNTGQTVLNSALNHNLYFCIAGLSKMILDKNGNIGINTIYPSEKLDVNGNIVLNAAGTDNDKGIFFRQGYNPGGTNTTINNRIYNCSILTHSHVGATSDGLSINGFDGVSICTDSNATRKERFRVASNGNVGIGTTSPNAKLHVVSGSGFDNTTTFKVLNAGEITIVRNHTRAPFINTNMSSGYPSLRLGQGSTDYTVIQGGQNQDSYFNSGGNLGIGTTSPNNRLEVIGTSKLDGHVGIGIDPEASGSLYKLKVNGQIRSTGLYVDGNTTTSGTSKLDGHVGIGIDPEASGSLYKLKVNGKIHSTGLFVNGDTTTSGTWYANGQITATSHITATGNITATGAIRSGSSSFSGEVEWYFENNAGSQYWVFKMGDRADNNDQDLYIYYGGTSTDDVRQARGLFAHYYNAGVISFTGQHRSKFEGEFTTELVGLIVESTGKYIEFDGSIAPTINEALPCVKLTSSARSKRVYGVLSDIEGERRESIGGVFITVYPKEDGINRVFVNSLGEGSLWVINTHNLENGDYVCSSNVPGYGELQDDDLLHSYTVAKITMDVDWSNLPEWLETRKVTANGVISETGEFTAAFVGVTYHCG